MINFKLFNPKCRINFGKGDIGIYNVKSENGIGYLFFDNLKYNLEIGTVVDINSKTTLKNVPVILTFSKKESVDSLINALERTKEYIR